MPHNALYLPLLWFYSQERQQKDRHRISQVGISDKRSAITLNQVGRHNKRNRKVTCRFPTSFSERVGHQVIVFGGGRCWRCPCGLGSCVFDRLPLRLQAGFRVATSGKEIITCSQNATIRHGFGRFWAIGQQAGQAQSEGIKQHKTGHSEGKRRKIIEKKSILGQKKGIFT